MGLLSGIKNLLKPAYQTEAYSQKLEQLFKKRSGLLQLQNRACLPDADMLPSIGKLDDGTWAAKITTQGKHDRFHIYYYGDATDEIIACLPDALPIRMKIINSFTREEIELFDEAYDGYNAVLNCFFEDEKLGERPRDKKYVTPQGSDEFKILAVVYYDEPTENELKEMLEKDGKILNDDDEEIDFDLAMRNGFSSIVIYAIDNEGNSFEIINQETA